MTLEGRPFLWIMLVWKAFIRRMCLCVSLMGDRLIVLLVVSLRRIGRIIVVRSRGVLGKWTTTVLGEFSGLVECAMADGLKGWWCGL